MNNVDRYTYRVFWSAEDGENVGVCAEFPGLSHLAKDPTHALAGIRALISFVLADLHKARKEVPLPLGAQKYSGHLHVRLPPNVHRELAILAQESGTSLNRVIVDRLAGGIFVRAEPAPVTKARSGTYTAVGRFGATARPPMFASKKAAKSKRAKKAGSRA